MNAPIRIQRKRTKGFKMPHNSVYVGRPTIYGNPFKPGSMFNNLGLWVVINGIMTQKEIDAWHIVGGRYISEDDAVMLYEKYIKWRIDCYPPLLEKLVGKNLACWCSLDQPCHADVLLKLANKAKP